MLLFLINSILYHINDTKVKWLVFHFVVISLINRDACQMV